MEKEVEKIFNNAKQIKLSTNEKDEMRGNIRAFMWQNPVKAKKENKYHKLAFIFSWRVAVAVFAFVIISGSAGASSLASKALPGDTLYPMKVNVNEEVKTFFAFTDEAKAEVDANLAEVRLLEVEKLAEAGRLDTAKREKLEREFKARADSFEEKVKKIEEKDKEKFESSDTKVYTEEQSKKKEKNKRKTEDLKNKFEERLGERERALENIRQKKNEQKQKDLEQKGSEKRAEEMEDEEDEVEPILKEVRGRIKDHGKQERED